MQSTEHPVQAEEVMALIDGELPPERASQVRAHVRACLQCRALGGDLGQVSRDLAAWRIGVAPETLRLPARENTTTPRTFAWWRLRVPVWATYSITSTAIAGLVLFAAAGSRIWREARGAPAPTIAAEPAVVATGPAASAPAVSEPAAPGGAGAGSGGENTAAAARQAVSPQRIAHACTIALVVENVDGVRPAIERILAGAGGFVGRIEVSGAVPAARRLTAELRVPAERRVGVLDDLRALGTVTGEAQSADEVTDQLIDLDARIANGRNTETRLRDLLQRRTGSLSDVLQAEREIARVRDDIERLGAQRARLDNRVTYATIRVQVAEQQKSSLDFGPLTLATRMRNAAIDGVRSAVASAADALILLLGIGPALVLWGGTVGAVVLVRRRVRGRRRATSGA